MAPLAGRTIAALCREHDTLAGMVPELSVEQLTGPSGVSGWTIADALSHLGSGAEITLAGFRAASGEAEAPGPDFDQSVWDRWNALAPQDQAAGWQESDAALVAALEGVPEQRHDDIKVAIGFGPGPPTLATFAAMRLSEVAPHAWDVRAGLDPASTLSETSAPLLAEHLSAGLGFLVGFIGKPAAAPEPAIVEIAKTPYRLVLDEKTQLAKQDLAATAIFTGPLESAVRLVYGRLTPKYSPAGIEVTGNLTLDDLRAVFPGF